MRDKRIEVVLTNAARLPRKVGVVQMRDGESERVRRVKGLRRDIEMKKQTYHLLNLMLFGGSVTDDRLLDETRRVFIDL